MKTKHQNNGSGVTRRSGRLKNKPNNFSCKNTRLRSNINLSKSKNDIIKNEIRKRKAWSSNKGNSKMLQAHDERKICESMYKEKNADHSEEIRSLPSRLIINISQQSKESCPLPSERKVVFVEKFVNDDTCESVGSQASLFSDNWLSENLASCKNNRMLWKKEDVLSRYGINRIMSNDAIFDNAGLENINTNELPEILAPPNIQITLHQTTPCNMDELCKGSTACSSEEALRSVSNGGDMFKMPLPPANRPPSRPKFSSVDCKCSSKEEPLVSKYEEDDALSIIAR